MQTQPNPPHTSGYQTVWSRPFSPADIDRMCAERFATGDKRSEPFKLGFKNCLSNRLLGRAFPPRCYAEASPELDAYFAGIDAARIRAMLARNEAEVPA